MKIENVKRHGNHIRIDSGITAIEGYDGSLPSLTIKKNGKQTAYYRGSSLCFSKNLTQEDKKYLISLAS